MSELITSQGFLPAVADTEKFTLKLTEVESAAKNLLAQANRAEIKDEETYAKGGDLVKIANTQKKGLDKKRMDFTKPFRDFTTAVNDACKAAGNDFDEAVSVIKKKMLDWKREEDKRRAEEARKERERLEAEALERAAAAGSEEDQEAILDTAAAAGEAVADRATVQTQYGSFGSTGTRKIYRTDITDVAAFLHGLTSPEGLAFLAKLDLPLGAIVDFRKAGLNQLAKLAREAGVTKASGAVFEEDETVSVR